MLSALGGMFPSVSLRLEECSPFWKIAKGSARTLRGRAADQGKGPRSALRVCPAHRPPTSSFVSRVTVTLMKVLVTPSVEAMTKRPQYLKRMHTDRSKTGLCKVAIWA